MQHRQAIAAAVGATVTGAALIVVETMRGMDAPMAGGLLIIGAMLVLGAFIGYATHLVNVRVSSANRPADEAFATGWDLGKASGYEERARECRSKHMQVVRPIRH